MFRLASVFLILALGSAVLGFGRLMPIYAVVPRLLFVVSVLMCLLMMMAGGVRHSRLMKTATVPVRESLRPGERR